MGSMKDQPIDTIEFNRLWEEIEDLWRTIDYQEGEWGNDADVLLQYRRLKEIKHRFFNQLVE